MNQFVSEIFKFLTLLRGDNFFKRKFPIRSTSIIGRAPIALVKVRTIAEQKYEAFSFPLTKRRISQTWSWRQYAG